MMYIYYPSIIFLNGHFLAPVYPPSITSCSCPFHGKNVHYPGAGQDTCRKLSGRLTSVRRTVKPVCLMTFIWRPGFQSWLYYQLMI